MSLRVYVRPRVVVLNSTATALEAGRAIENNNIGAVLVQDRGRLLGMVTDRDLAARVVAAGLDSKTTLLADVMTTGIITLSPSDRQVDAVRLMSERRIRRIPLVEGERVVGIVTLDDLLLDEAAPLDELAGVVEAQIGPGGPAAPIRTPALRRRLARAEASYARMLARVQDASALKPEEAETALEIVLSSVLRRLTPNEARDLVAQLPSLLQQKVDGLAPGPDKLITRDSITAELQQGLGVDAERAVDLLRAIAGSIAESVSSGQVENVRAQLPLDLRAFFASSEPTRAAA
jgi:CBS domain-containing protein/uncharacterized protein (DUF2267 family)